MLALVDMAARAFDHPPSLRTLRAMAAQHELVLTCAGAGAVHRLVHGLPQALPRYRAVTLLVRHDVSRHERELVKQILEDGHIPVLVSMGDPAAVARADWRWLAADTRLVLPADPHHIGRRAPVVAYPPDSPPAIDGTGTPGSPRPDRASGVCPATT